MNIALIVLFWIVFATIITFLVLDIIRAYHVKIGDINPDTIPRIKLTNYSYYILVLLIVLNLINSFIQRMN